MYLCIQYFLLFSAVPTTSVSDITVARINETAVRVTWTALTLNDARGFPSYVVSVMSRCEQVSSQRTPFTSVVVGGLMPHTEYSVTVQALTAGGTKEGPISAPGKIDTEQIMPYLPHVHVSVILFMLRLHLTLKDHAFGTQMSCIIDQRIVACLHFKHTYST